MKVLILAQGTGKRWEDNEGNLFLGKPKQLVVIDGETLVHRAKRLFQEAGCDVVVIASHPEIQPDVTLDNPFPTGTEMDKFIGTQELWNKQGRTIIAWGDCFYTEEAVNTIVSHKADDLHYFRRPIASKITGHKWDESFAVSFGADWHDKVLEVANIVVDAVNTGQVKKDHIRTHYAAYLGVPLDNVNVLLDTPHQTIIDDWTDDFDSPEEWTRWVGRYYRHKIKLVGAAAWKPGCLYRELSMDFVHEHYESEMPLYYGSHEGAMFNRSAARNAAVDSIKEDWEVVCLFDTDVFVSHEQLWAAAYLSSLKDECVLAFTTFVTLEKTESIKVLRGFKNTKNKGYKQHPSCAVFIPKGLWEECGGYDERFASWGSEDRAIWFVCNALRGNTESLRIPGCAYHLWHPISKERNPHLLEYQANVELGKRYRTFSGWTKKGGIIPEINASELNPEQMRAILREPGGPKSDYVKVGRPTTSNPTKSQSIAKKLQKLRYLRNTWKNKNKA